MAIPSATRSKIRRETAQLAVDALLKWMRVQSKHQQSQLLEHDDLLYLVLTIKRIPPNGRTNASLIPLPHSLHPLDASSPNPSSICIIVDDRPKSPLSPAAARARILSDYLPVADVIGLSDLRSDYIPFEARRRLCDSHDLFFADRRILPLLPRILGKQFFRRKKIPLAVDFSRKGWPEQIRHCCGSTLLYLRTGTCSGLKVGRVSQERDQIVDNVMAAIEGAVAHVPRKWANVRSFHIKSVDSLALPIYQSVPELGLKIDAFQKKEVSLIEEKDEATKISTTKTSLKKRKKGRIHEVLQMDTDEGDVSGDDDCSAQVEDNGGYEKGSEDDGMGVGNRVKKKNVNGMVVKKEKLKTGKMGNLKKKKGTEKPKVDGLKKIKRSMTCC